MHGFQLGADKIDAEVSVKLIMPKAGAKDAFLDAMANSEGVSYSGHARYGMGMDFDDKESSKENVVLGDNSAGHRSGKYKRAYNRHIRDVNKGKENDLERMSREGKFDPEKYQVMVLSACNSKNYLDEMRGGLMKGKDRDNLDIIATNKTAAVDNAVTAQMQFIYGLLTQKSTDRIMELMGKYEDDNPYFADM